MGNIPFSSPSSPDVDQGEVLPKTSSRCVTDSATGAHNFDVASYSTISSMAAGEFVTSATFTVGGLDWNIRFCPNPSREHPGSVSIYLCLCKEATGFNTKYKLTLRDRDGGNVYARKRVTHRFERVGDAWGFIRFMDKSELERRLARRGGGEDGFTIRCVLTVMKEPRTEDDVGAVAVPRPNLRQHFGEMLRDGEGADVVVAVRGRAFRAHRCVLAARSPAFRAELVGKPKEKGSTQYIDVDDMEPSIFEALVHFIYTDSLPEDWNACQDCDHMAMQQLLVAADRYGIDRLRMICEAKLCKSVDKETVSSNLVFSVHHKCVHLKDACIVFLASMDVLG